MTLELEIKNCKICNKPIPQDSPFPSYCGQEHQDEASRKAKGAIGWCAIGTCYLCTTSECKHDCHGGKA